MKKIIFTIATNSYHLLIRNIQDSKKILKNL